MQKTHLVKVGKALECTLKTGTYDPKVWIVCTRLYSSLCSYTYRHTHTHIHVLEMANCFR